MSAKEQAKAMLLKGVAQVEIMRTTGLSRNAVAGMALRLREAGAPVATAGKSRGPSRARDEEVLLWIARRHAGMKVGEIALRSGTGAGQVSKAVGDVYAADLAESGESPKVVRAAYWPQPVAFGRYGRGRRK